MMQMDVMAFLNECSLISLTNIGLVPSILLVSDRSECGPGYDGQENNQLIHRVRDPPYIKINVAYSCL